MRTSPPADLAGALAAKFNILLVDDRAEIVDAVTELFPSSHFTVTAATTLPVALRHARKPDAVWHSWIVDMSISSPGDGLEVLRTQPDFPFAFVLSGLGSMKIAGQAMALGVRHVYDKDPPQVHAELVDAVCKACALAQVFGTSRGKYFAEIDLLTQSLIRTPEEWAEAARTVPRNLERVCVTYSGLTPRRALPLYYALYALLRDGCMELLDDSPDLPRETEKFCQECTRFVQTRQTEYYGKWFCRIPA